MPAEPTESEGAHPQTLEIHAMPGHLIRRMQQIAVSIWLDETGSDLRPVQYAALSAIRHLPGMDQLELARVVGIDRSTAQDVLIRLEKRHYLERRKDPRDARRRRLFITSDGAAALDNVAEANSIAQARILDGLSEEERALFMNLLQRLVLANGQYSRAQPPLKPDDDLRSVTA
ncbi:MAG: MarR family winged helix-turn-helix transcriptional regulator [Devosia sp.]